MLDLAVVPAQASTGHVAFGLMILVSVGFSVAYLIVTKDDGNLTDTQRTVRDQVRAALDDPANTIRFDAHGIRTGSVTSRDIQTGLRETFENETVDAPETAGQAVKEIREAVGGAWRDATDGIPSHVLALGEWAVLVAVFGTIAVATGTIITALSWQAGRMTLAEYLDYIQTVAGNGVDLAVSLAFYFPYSGLIFDLGFAYVVLVVDAVYHHPWAFALFLLAVAAVLYVVERDVGSDIGDPELVRKRFILAGLGSLIAVWLTGTTVMVLTTPVFGAIGRAGLSHAAGFLVAMVVAVVLAWVGSQELKWRVRHAARGVDARLAVVAAVLTGRIIAGVLRPLAILVVGLYLISSIATGSLWAVLHALATASIEVKLTAGAATLLLGVLIARELADAIPEVKRTLVELQARERARASAALSSIPYLGVAFTFVAAWAWHLPILLGLILAVLAGIGFRSAVKVYHRARRRHAERDDTTPPQGSILAACRTINTIQGDRYYVTLAGEHYAHEDRSELIDTLVDVIQAVAHGRDPEATVEEWFARNLREFGLADYSETYSVDQDGYLSGKVPERAHKRIKTRLREAPDRRCHRDQLIDDACDDIPTAIASRRLAEMLTTPALRQHGDGTIRLKDDIWAKMVDDSRDVERQRVEEAI